MRKALLVLVTVAAVTALAAPAQAAPPTLISCTDRDALIYLDTTWNCEYPPGE